MSTVSFASTHIFVIIIPSLISTNFAQTNLALYKPAVESTSSKDGYYKPASNAVDGNPGTCAFADNPSQSDPAWWQVDLLEPYTVSSVAILFPNSEDDQYLQGFLIMISSDNITTFIPGTSICYTFYNTSSLLFHGVQMTFTCTEPIQGQYVTIIRNLGQQLWTVSLCEIVVTGSKYIELASHQPATEAKQYASRSAGLAVDGIATDCATTDPDTNGAAWWQVDLGATYTITSVTVTSDPNSAYDAAYLKNFYVYVSDSNSTNSFPTLPVCNSYSNQSGVQVGQQITVNCSQQSPVSGRYVTFKAKDTSLTVCNVLVFGFNPDPITVTSPTTTTTTTTIFTTTATMITTTIPLTNKITSTIVTTASAATQATAISPSLGTGSTTSLGSTTTTNSTEPEVLSPGAIAGIVIGAVIGFVLIIFLILFLVVFIRRKRDPTYDWRELRPKFHTNYTKNPKEENIVATNGSYVEMNEKERKDKPTIAVKPNVYKQTLMNPIDSHDLQEYIETHKSTNFGKEFKELNDKELEKVTIAKLKENEKKNRFTNILPYDKTLVPLAVEAGDNPSDNFINANYIAGYPDVDKKYIATQGPKPMTVNAFWRMIWQQNVNTIIMITPLVEKGKAKCSQYWQEGSSDEVKSCENIEVTTSAQHEYADYVYRELVIRDKRKPTEKERLVRHMHFLSWSDKGVPEQCYPLLNFRKKVNMLAQETTGPLVVHCSAGIGRTGTYIALDFLIEQMKAEGRASVFGCVDKLRHQRMNMVQTAAQYTFLYEALLEGLIPGDTSMSCDNFEREFRKLNRASADGSMSALEQQFLLLKKLKWSKIEDRQSAGRNRENMSKNRDTEIVAYDDCRPYLTTMYNNGSNYINAVFVDGYRSRDAYILTQCPLPETIDDFWSLVWSQKIRTIALLEEIERTTDKSCPVYWPQKIGSRTNYGGVEVTLKSSFQEPKSFILIREFSLTCLQELRSEALVVRQFCLKDVWPAESVIPINTSSILELISAVTRWQRTTGSDAWNNAKLIAQCINGVYRSGLFSAGLCLLERMAEEAEVDVFVSCRVITSNRPQAIDTLEQYTFLHELVSARMLATAGEGTYYNELG